MVVDAPCSGSGLFRKDEEAIREWSPNNVELCSQRQQRILADALPALKEGGLPARTPIDNLAQMLMTVFQGMTVRARAGADHKELLQAGRGAIAAWPKNSRLLRKGSSD